MNNLVGVFNGQGAVFPGMMRDFGENGLQIIQETFQEASGLVNEDLWRMSDRESTVDLSLPENAQLLTLVSGVASFRVWENAGGHVPSTVSGHSVGMLPALVASGHLSFPAAVEVALERARLMKKAVPDGSTVVFLGSGVTPQFMEEVRGVCEETKGGADIAVINFDGQFAISGEKKWVDYVAKKVARTGVKAQKLRMGAVHCRRMKMARERFMENLRSVVIRESGRMEVDHGDDHTDIRQALADQLVAVEDWRGKVKRLFRRKPRIFIGFGAKDILSSFIGKILFGHGVHCFCICDQASLDEALAAASV